MKLTRLYICIIPFFFSSCASLYPSMEELQKQERENLAKYKANLERRAEHNANKLRDSNGKLTLDDCMAIYGPPTNVFRGDYFIQLVYREVRPSPFSPYEYRGDTSEYETRTFYFTKWMEGDMLILSGQHILRDVQYEYDNPCMGVYYRNQLDFRRNPDEADSIMKQEGKSNQ